MIEQLHYTWAREGLQGLGRFQVTAASPGLTDLTSPTATLALRLCRFSTGGGHGEAPVSFGWIDARGLRFVFRRIAVTASNNRDQRPGNFAAHVIVGSTGELPLPRVLTSSPQPVWWDGDEESTTRLPALPLAPALLPLMPFHAAGEPEVLDKHTREALVLLLERGFAGRVPAGWAPLVQAMSVCAKHIPEAVAGLGSFSSYEAGESAAWFALTGASPCPDGPANGSPSSSMATAVADLLLSDRPQDQALLRASIAGCLTRNGAVAWRDFVLSAGASVMAERGQVDVRALAAALRRGAVATEILNREPVVELVVDAVTRPATSGIADPLLAALGDAAADVDPDVLERLGTHVGHRCGDAPQAWATAARHAEGVHRQLLRGMARVGVGTSLDVLRAAGSAALACEYLTLSQCPAALEQAAIAQVAASAYATGFVTDVDAPATRRGLVLAAVLTSGQLDVTTAARAWAVDRPLAVATLTSGLEPATARAVLGRLHPQQAAPLVADAAQRADPQMLAEACRAMVRRLPGAQAHTLVAQVRQACRGKGPEWDNLSDLVLMRRIRDQLAGAEPMSVTVLREACSSSSTGRVWRDFLSSLRARGAGGLADNQLTRSRLAVQALPQEEQELAASYALQVLVPRAMTAEEILACLEAFVSWRGLRPRWADALQAVERELAEGRAVACRLLLEALISEERLDRSVWRECALLASHLSEDSWQRLSASVHDADRKARQRFGDLQKARKAEPNGGTLEEAVSTLWRRRTHT